ncbi:hypothetical protein VTJ83DRAFT_2331 [Remersonia thermophila]|uniref:Manganese/iron superoxide dismutase C-terminal domain-containing protein n=1 Tax=Remersonia thermophila TaxID=72144 RepID=A0ABR4DIP8_9PEZI
MMRPRLRIPLRPCMGMAPRPRMFRPFSAAGADVAQPQPAHMLPPLSYEEEVKEKGLGSFLTAGAFNIAWYGYQAWLLNNINEKTAETAWEHRSIKDIVLNTAREPSQAALFNYASMAHNNHFFFQHLTPTPVNMPDELKRSLEQSFGSIDTLRREMVATAATMFGPGFVWLVATSQTGLPIAFRVLTTYAAGSPYPAAHWRRQSLDMNAVTGAGDGVPEADLAAARGYLARSAAGAAAPARQKQLLSQANDGAYAPGGTNVAPVLCLSTWEHSWLWDYGFGGKERYANAWWEHVNWALVAEMAKVNGKNEMSADAGVPKSSA